VPAAEALAVSRPEDLEPAGARARPVRVAAAVDGLTAAAYLLAAAGIDPLGLSGEIHLATLAVTELLLRLFSEPFDLILAQDRRLVSRWMQTELVLVVGGVLGIFVMMVAAGLRSGVPVVTYTWRIANRVLDVWAKPVGSREQAQNNRRLNVPLGLTILPLATLTATLGAPLPLSPAVAGAVYFAAAAWMEWTGWRLDLLAR
jgi:hypothetical protein